MDLLPFDTDIERAALSAFLINPQAVAPEIAVLPATAFYSQTLQTLYGEMCRVYAKHDAIDMPLLLTHLRDRGQMDAVGGRAAILEILDCGASSRHISAYVATLQDLDARRQAIRGADELAAIAKTEGYLEVQAALDSLQAKFRKADTLRVQKVTLADAFATEDETVPWLVNGWLARGDLVCLAGEWGTGKSSVAIDLALSVAAGLPFLGRALVSEPIRVLYVDEENNPFAVRRKLRRMAQGRGINGARPDLAISYLVRNGVSFSNARGRSILTRELEQFRPDLLILDSIVRFHNRQGNSNDEMASLFNDRIRPLQAQYGVTILYLDHMGKPPADGKENRDVAHRILGASDKSAVVDVIWVVTGDKKTGDRKIEQRKNRWTDQIGHGYSLSWQAEDEEGPAWIQADDLEHRPEEAVLRILEVRNGVATPREIKEAAETKGLSARSVDRALGSLRASGRVERITAGGVVYRLVSRSEPS